MLNHTIRSITVASLMILLIFSLSSCSRENSETSVVDETSAASIIYESVDEFRADYSLIAASWDESGEEALSPTGYGGSVPFQRWDLVPEIKTNFAGIAFSKDYKEDRGHVWAWEDLFETERTGANSPGACLTCKTTEIAEIFDTNGWDYASMNLEELAAGVHAGIDCFTCHDNSGAFKVVQPAFIEAMNMMDINWESLSHDEQAVYTCAQCHSEYYFAKTPEGTIASVVHPWAMGLDPEDQYAYYESIQDEFSGDFTQPDSGVSLIKAQHPDYEEYRTGIHAAAGVSCADCHLPNITVNGESFPSHKITSPLKTVTESCLSCHTGRTEEWMIARVQNIQDSVFNHMRRSGLTLERAHNKVAAASNLGVIDADLEVARELIRESQWYWDFTASANSHGFHNSSQAHDNLSRAADLAAKAIESAIQAAGRPL
jgi:nitrite reductase (cytochrome c-552)